MKTYYLLQLALGAGDGMSSTYDYFVVNCSTYPVDSKSGMIDDETLEALREKYPEAKKFLYNSGYHTWSVIGLGSASSVNRLYETYKQTVSQLRILRSFGFHIK